MRVCDFLDRGGDKIGKYASVTNILKCHQYPQVSPISSESFQTQQIPFMKPTKLFRERSLDFHGFPIPSQKLAFSMGYRDTSAKKVFLVVRV
jgi:hypothetical protein